MRGSPASRAFSASSRARRRRPTAGRRPGGRPWRRAGHRGPCGARGGRGRRSSAPVGRPRVGLGEALDLDAVEERARSSPPSALGHAPGVLGHRAAQVEAAGQPPHERPQHAVGAARSGGVERADQRRALNSSAVMRRARAPAARGGGATSKASSPRARIVRSCADGVGGDRRHRAVGRRSGRLARAASRRRRAADRRTAPSTRASWPSDAQRPGQAEHLPLHAAGDA